MSVAERLSPRPPEIVTSRVVEKFFTKVLSEDRPIHSLTIVSPWISEWESGNASLRQLAVTTQAKSISTLILTRPPIDDWHESALDMFADSEYAKVLTIPDLHAKLFLCESVPAGFGMIGSANLTKKSLSNVELGVMFEGRGLLSHLLRDLRTLAWQDLRRFARPYEGG